MTATYLSDPGAFRVGQELMNVTIDGSDVEGLRAIQEALRCGIAQRGIIVEVNPTSNLLIGDILDLRQHPLLRLFPIEPGSIPPVHIAIGSDDPVTFSTSLAGEYAILYDTARAAGYSAMAVEHWLDRIRRTSLDARFTCSWRPNALAKADKLLAALDQYLLRPKERPSWLPASVRWG